jgi:hypothetical protein
MAETPSLSESPRHFDEHTFKAAVAMTEDATTNTRHEGAAATWQSGLRELHTTEGGDLSNAVQEYLSTLPSDEQRLGFVTGLRVGVLMTRSVQDSGETSGG